LLLSSTLVLDKQRVFAADEEEGTEKGHKDTRSYLQDVDKLNINVPDLYAACYRVYETLLRLHDVS
jgi:hypothetical protein